MMVILFDQHLNFEKYRISKIILPRKNFTVPYFSANFIFNSYNAKFCWMKKLYTGPKSRTSGHKKSCIGIKKWVSEFFAIFRRISLDFRLHQLFKESEIKSFVLRKFFFRRLDSYDFRKKTLIK